MKNLFILIASLLCFFASCKKQPLETVNEISPSTDVIKTRATVNYTPSLNVYPTVSSPSVTLTGGGVSYTGGTIRAMLIQASYPTYKIRITKINNTAFSVAGTARVKAAWVGGSQLGSASYSVGATYVDVTLTASLSTGYLHLYPVVQGSGGSYYAEPILLWTSPLYNTSAPYNGYLYGTANGVNVNASGTTNQSLTSTWQCVEFIKRYYLQVYGMNFGSNGNAINYNTSVPAGMVRYANGSSTAPRPGDIIVFNSPAASNGTVYGHIGIVMEVATSYVKIAHQNGGTNASYGPIGAYITRSGNTVGKMYNSNSYPTLCWLRKN